MNSTPTHANISTELDIDLQRTDRPEPHGDLFYWDNDTLVRTGQKRIDMTHGLSRLLSSIKTSFKLHLISFSKQGTYSATSCTTFFMNFRAALNSNPPEEFNAGWIAHSIARPGFHGAKRVAIEFFLHWKERYDSAIKIDALHLLQETAARPNGPRNVLSDDPEKSWLTEDEYESLLMSTWNNYDTGVSDTQVTLIKILSMQYARRPNQIALLKAGDIRGFDESKEIGLTGRIIDFPGIKDQAAETGFRDSKFEPHPLADHVWGLCQIQRQEVRELYEHTLGLSLTDDQLNLLPFFCSEERIKEARSLIETHLKLELLDSLDSPHFHLERHSITEILRWKRNTPSCAYGAAKGQYSKCPKAPISPRTSRVMIINATRMRHTRARQLARKGVPKNLLSHWLGHTTERALEAYYNDPAEQARVIDEAMGPALAPLAMAFAGALIDSDEQATRATDPTSKLEFSRPGELLSVGRCGKHSFCATTSVPIPCYRCKHFEPLVHAPHHEVLDALLQRQSEENQALRIGGQRNLLIPIDLSADILAVKNCITRCNNRIVELGLTQ
ncbi:TPA: site-specific integrase [Pseudomonas aeruginosa]|nr:MULTISPECIES: site-specific integrase [Pseudomonadaceae]MBU2012786.1 site-specific integrase [Gammaproteobacteria bacterium]MEB2327439.1 site-specific integrase [Pseudomonas sp.]WOF79101.1 site-specific integrase [Pseudomonas sp. FeN3W]CEG51565.1 Phage integrase family protein [Stutzerimonas xanthomarina]EKN0215590.1 site-specific integrase [Pseudomonas aeruginosa]